MTMYRACLLFEALDEEQPLRFNKPQRLLFVIHGLWRFAEKLCLRSISTLQALTQFHQMDSYFYPPI